MVTETLLSLPKKTISKRLYFFLICRVGRRNREGSSLAKKARVDESCRASMEEIMKAMNYGSIRRKSREVHCHSLQFFWFL